jgi:hypothetical protein
MPKLESAYSDEDGENRKSQQVFRKFAQQFPNGSVSVLPVVKGYGSAIRWEVRAHSKNAIGPLKLTKEVAAEIGASPVVVEAAEQVREQLQRKHPTYPYRSGEVVGLIRREMLRLQDNDDLR